MPAPTWTNCFNKNLAIPQLPSRNSNIFHVPGILPDINLIMIKAYLSCHDESSFQQPPAKNRFTLGVLVAPQVRVRQDHPATGNVLCQTPIKTARENKTTRRYIQACIGQDCKESTNEYMMWSDKSSRVGRERQLHSVHTATKAMIVYIQRILRPQRRHKTCQHKAERATYGKRKAAIRL